jgi:RimJ/RimL family protein N-acetyltransferase
MTSADWVRLPSAPQLTDGGGLVLRLPQTGDVNDIVAYARDPEMVRWTTVPVPYGIADATDSVQAAAEGWHAGVARFAIEYQGRFAGGTHLSFKDHGRAEVGYGLAPWARGQGVMTRALRLMLAWGFELPGLDVVDWHAVEGNWASRRVAQRCGFRMDGTVLGRAERRGFRRNAWTASLRRGEPLTGRHG